MSSWKSWSLWTKVGFQSLCLDLPIELIFYNGLANMKFHESATYEYAMLDPRSIRATWPSEIRGKTLSFRADFPCAGYPRPRCMGRPCKTSYRLLTAAFYHALLDSHWSLTDLHWFLADLSLISHWSLWSLIDLSLISRWYLIDLSLISCWSLTDLSEAYNLAIHTFIVRRLCVSLTHLAYWLIGIVTQYWVYLPFVKTF